MALEWYVWVSNWNSKEIELENIFEHSAFLQDIKKAARKYRDRDRLMFETQMRRDLMYYFWGKCEWEIVLDHWPHADSFKGKKIDVYEQVHANWKPFCDYVWAHRGELRRHESL